MTNRHYVNTSLLEFRDFLVAIIEQLREAIAKCGLSQNELSRQTGIQQASLSRFLAGKRGLRIEDADKLAKHFGLELRPTEMRKPPKSKTEKAT